MHTDPNPKLFLHFLLHRPLRSLPRLSHNLSLLLLMVATSTKSTLFSSYFISSPSFPYSFSYLSHKHTYLPTFVIPYEAQIAVATITNIVTINFSIWSSYYSSHYHQLWHPTLDRGKVFGAIYVSTSLNPINAF